MERIVRSLAAFFITVSLAACSQSAASSPEAEAEHPALVTYKQIRSYLAQGDIAAAAKLSDDPAAFSDQYARAMERKGEAAFKAQMRKALTEAELHSLRDAGDYAMVLLKLPANQYSPVAAVFFKRKTENQYVELTKSDLDIPCPLLDHFYATKGEPDAKYVCKN